MDEACVGSTSAEKDPHNGLLAGLNMGFIWAVKKVQAQFGGRDYG